MTNFVFLVAILRHIGISFISGDVRVLKKEMWHIHPRNRVQAKSLLTNHFFFFMLSQFLFPFFFLFISLPYFSPYSLSSPSPPPPVISNSLRTHSDALHASPSAPFSSNCYLYEASILIKIRIWGVLQ